MSNRVSKDIWNKSKDGAHKEERSFIRYAIIAFGVFLLVIFVKKDSVVRWVQAKYTIHKQEKQMEYFQKEIARLDDQIELLSNDKDSLETYAREQFHFAEEGDDVYLIQE